jgi:hypothetical protein
LQRFTKTYKENHVEYISIFKDLQKLIKQTTLNDINGYNDIAIICIYFIQQNSIPTIVGIITRH